MITLSIALTDDAENGAFGVRVAVGSFVGLGVSVAGTKLAGVVVAGGVIDGSNVAVGPAVPLEAIHEVGVGVQVGSICKSVGVAVGTSNSGGFSGFKSEPGLIKIVTK